MKFEVSKEWLVACLTRTIKTVAQTLLGMITVGAALQDINWLQSLSVAAVAGIYCILTSIVFGLPEADYSGTLTVNHTGEMALEIPDEKTFQQLANGQKSATFKVESTATRAEEVLANA